MKVVYNAKFQFVSLIKEALLLKETSIYEANARFKRTITRWENCGKKHNRVFGWNST